MNQQVSLSPGARVRFVSDDHRKGFTGVVSGQGIPGYWKIKLDKPYWLGDVEYATDEQVKLISESAPASYFDQNLYDTQEAEGFVSVIPFDSINIASALAIHQSLSNQVGPCLHFTTPDGRPGIKFQLPPAPPETKPDPETNTSEPIGDEDEEISAKVAMIVFIFESSHRSNLRPKPRLLTYPPKVGNNQSQDWLTIPIHYGPNSVGIFGIGNSPESSISDIKSKLGKISHEPKQISNSK
jgi:hypothetical protein